MSRQICPTCGKPALAIHEVHGICLICLLDLLELELEVDEPSDMV